MVTMAMVTAARADAATFVVNSTADTADNHVGDGVCNTSGGVCTLRAAIQEANATAGLDTITFAIGSGVQTINAGSGFVVTNPVVIDGTTQPGYAGQPLVVVHGGSGDGITLNGTGSTVRGLVISGFSGNGVTLAGGGSHVLEGNYIGLTADGSQGDGNADGGVLVNGGTNNRIGGKTVAQRNVISGNTGKGNTGGVKIDGGATGTIIQGNYIGSDATGMIPIGNEGRGVAIHSGSNNFVGGAAQGAGNLIMGNRATGVRVISGTGNLVMGNMIGLRSDGTYEFGVTGNARGIQFRTDGNNAFSNYVVGNLYDGVLMYSGSASNNTVQSNVIYGNGLHGIDVSIGTGNALLSNYIFANGYLGISVSSTFSSTPTPNDAGDGDSGPNNQQNYPVLASASTAGAVAGSLNSKPNQSFTVQFFAGQACNPSGNGDGNYYIGQTTVNTNGSGNASFSAALGVSLPAGWVVTSTATDSGRNTSEFSACATVK
jgi:CSLREA domain-containing protein